MYASPSISIPAPVPRRHRAARRWNADWDRLVVSADAAAALARWRDEPRLAAPDLDSLLRAAGAGRSGDPEAAEAVLGELVGRAPTDPIAARVVLQRVLPGLVVVAKRHAIAERQATAEVLDELVATAWTVIVTYPGHRRPAKFAANIVRDAEYVCFVQDRRLRRVIEVLTEMDEHDGGHRSCALDGRPDDDRVNPSETVLALITDAERRGLTGDDLRLLRALYLDDLPLTEVANERRIGPRALRYRRTAAIRRLARLAA